MITKSRMPFVTVISIFSLLAALCVATPGLAGDKLLVKAHVDTSVKNESNYYKAEDAEEDAVAFIVNPGVTLGYTTGKTQVDFSYDLKGHIFSEEPEGVSDYTEHIGNVGFKSALTDRIKVKLSDSFMYTRDPASLDTVTNEISREKYFLNRFSPSVLYNFNEKLVAGLKYQRSDTDYKDDNEGEDSTENKGGFDLYYNLNSTSRATFDYMVWDRDFDKNSTDYTSNQARLGYTMGLKHVTLMAKAGVNSRSFDDDGKDDVDEFIWNVTVLAQNPPYPAEKPKSHGKFILDRNMNNTASTYKSTKVSAEGGYIFNEKIDVVLAASFQNSDYEFETVTDGSARDDDTWACSAKVDYLINDMWVAGIKGGLESRDSNKDGKDYDNDYVLFHVDFNYDFGSK